jgi:hypothetical protein
MQGRRNECASGFHPQHVLHVNLHPTLPALLPAPLTWLYHHACTCLHCLSGCAEGYGVFPVGSSSGNPAEQFWKHEYIKNFVCQQCPEGKVPFVEGSNLELVWDGATWTLRLIDNGTSRIRGAQQRGARTAGGVLSSEEGYSWYGRAYPAYSQGADVLQPPYFIGQCVPCPQGSYQDGLRCECTATAVQQPTPMLSAAAGVAPSKMMQCSSSTVLFWCQACLSLLGTVRRTV